MTAQKQLKVRIRARMARTGESYTTARRHVAGTPDAVVSGPGYQLRGGQHPDSAAIANVLAHHGVRCGGAEITEALVFGAAGGPGAGYILWEFAHDGSRPVTIGFSWQAQYFDRAILAALERLGVPVRVKRTGGAVGASHALADAVESGPVLVWPDRQLVGYWNLPATLDGMGGHPVVVHGLVDDRYSVDDRGLAPLTVPRAQLDVARARVGSYKNLLLAPEPAGDVPVSTLRAALADGIATSVAQLSGTSTSFALPAWRKWARLITDPKAAKGWPQVFADGRALAGALASVWEGVSQAGMTGGHLRDLTADLLDAAGPVLDTDLSSAAAAWREAGAAWAVVADTALPVDVPEFARLRSLTVAIQQSIVGDGDAGRAEAAAASAELWALRAELDAAPPLTPGERDDLFAALGGALTAVHSAEVAAVRELGAASARLGT